MGVAIAKIKSTIAENALPSLDEIRLAINDKTIWTSLGSGKMTVTIGAGKYKVGQDYKEWISFADKQLYVGKCTGKNKVVC